MSENDSFYQFQALPLEIQQKIWRLCLPVGRISFVHDTTFLRNVFHPDLGQTRQQRPMFRNALPPVISKVCQEARYVAIEENASSGRIDLRHWTDKHNNLRQMQFTPPAMFDILRELPSSMTSIDKAVRSQLAIVDRIAVHESLLEPLGNLVKHLLRQVDEWLVITHGFNIRAAPDLAKSSSLFGLLGDAPLQIIDIDDDRLVPFLELARQYRVIVPRVDSLKGAARRQLNESIVTHGLSHLNICFRPAICFTWYVEDEQRDIE